MPPLQGLLTKWDLLDGGNAGTSTRHVTVRRIWIESPCQARRADSVPVLPENATADRNEEDVCAAVKKFSETMPNQGSGKVWMTTKVMGHEHGTEATRKAVDESVAIAEKYGLKWVRLSHSKDWPFCDTDT